MSEQISEEYLGDGLYISFDGWQICLRAPREHGDHVVFIEPTMWADLADFARKCWSPATPTKLDPYEPSTMDDEAHREG